MASKEYDKLDDLFDGAADVLGGIEPGGLDNPDRILYALALAVLAAARELDLIRRNQAVRG